MSSGEGQAYRMELDASDNDYYQWLSGNNVEINGVHSAFISDKGRGIVATRKLKEGERLVFVPASALLSVPRPNPHVQISNNARPSVHAGLTLKLLLNIDMKDPKHSLRLWWNMMPNAYVMRDIPLMWPEPAQRLLPDRARALLERQRTNVQRDWAYFQSMKLLPSRIGLPADSLPNVVYDAFVYAWLLVNTRSFYWDYPTAASDASKLAKSKKLSTGSTDKPLPASECMALVPFIDLFNHSYVGESCEVEFNSDGFTVTAGRDYEPGEEVFVTYGNHSNDSLLVEYGFMVDPNVSDVVSLDQYVIPEFSESQRELLKEKDLFGNYNLHASTSPSKATPPAYCYRTECALRVLKFPVEMVQRFIESGGDDGELTSAQRLAIQDMWKHICGHVFENVMKMKQRIETELQPGEVQEHLLDRWNEISDMVYATI